MSQVDTQKSAVSYGHDSRKNDRNSERDSGKVAYTPLLTREKYLQKGEEREYSSAE